MIIFPEIVPKWTINFVQNFVWDGLMVRLFTNLAQVNIHPFQRVKTPFSNYAPSRSEEVSRKTYSKFCRLENCRDFLKLWIHIENALPFYNQSWTSLVNELDNKLEQMSHIYTEKEEYTVNACTTENLRHQLLKMSTTPKKFQSPAFTLYHAVTKQHEEHTQQDVNLHHKSTN